MQISESETEALKEPELAETENGETGVEQSRAGPSFSDNFLRRRGDRTRRLRPEIW